VGQGLTWLCDSERIWESVMYLIRIESIDQIIKFPNKHNEETLGRRT